MENVTSLTTENVNLSSNTSAATIGRGLYTMVTERFIIYCLISPIIIAVGFTGNVATLIVIHRIKERTSTSQYLVTLAVSDILTLCVRTIYMICVWAQLHWPEDYLRWKINSFSFLKLAYTTERISKSTILAIVIERVLAVTLPLKVKTLFTPRRTSFSIMTICLVISALSIPDTLDLFIYDYNTELKDRNFPMTQKEARQYLKEHLSETSFQSMLNKINRIVLDSLPIPLVMIGNILIINGLRRSVGNTRRNTGEKSGKSKRKLADRNLTVSLLMVSVCFLVLCTPFDFYAFSVLAGIIKISNATLVSSEIFKIGTLMNCSINFLIYAVMNKRYKKEYKKLICPCIWRKEKRNNTEMNRLSLSVINLQDQDILTEKKIDKDR